MRINDSILSARVAAAMFAALVFAGATANAAELAPVTPTQNAYIWDTPSFDGSGDARDFGGSMTVGEMDSGAIQRLARGVIHFELPELAAGEVLQSATLRFYVSNVVNDDGLLQDITLYHSQSWNNTTVPESLYENASYLNTGLTPITPSTQINSWVTIDATALVLQDYALDPSENLISSFRMQIDGLVFVGDDKSHRYTIQGLNSVDYAPQLLLTTTAIPEVSISSLGLGLVALFATVYLRCSRR